MTLSTVATPAVYTSTGITATFSFSYYVFLTSHLQVKVKSIAGAETTLTLSPDGSTKDYTATLTSTGGSVTLLSTGGAWMAGGVLIAGWTITITRLVPNTQLTNVRGENRYNPEIHENEYDLLVMADQYMSYVLTQLQGLVNVNGYLALPTLTQAPPAPTTGIVLYNLSSGLYLINSSGTVTLVAAHA